MSTPIHRRRTRRAFAGFQAVVAEVAQTRDWDRWADQFTVDADYVEHAMGTFKGREQIRKWINKTMHSFPGSHMTGYPSLWHVVDAPLRVICGSTIRCATPAMERSSRR